MDIGFIGLGIMGKPMAKNLLKAGHKLVVYDILDAPVKELVQAGATAEVSYAGFRIPETKASPSCVSTGSARWAGGRVAVACLGAPPRRSA